MSAADWTLFGVGLVLVVSTGFFAAAEIALITLDRSELEARRTRGERGLSRIIHALSHTPTQLSGAQLGITLTTLVAGFLLEPAFGTLLTPVLQWWRLPDAWVGPVASVAAVLIATLLSMIIGELIPKNLALALPTRMAKLVMPVQVGFTAVLRPFVWLLTRTAHGVVKAFGVEPREELSSARNDVELRSLLRRSASIGTLDQETATLIARSLAFASLTAAEIMTPRPRVVSVERDATAQQVIDLTRSTGLSRFPVTGEGLDDVLGVVHVKQAVRVPRDDRDATPVTKIMGRALFVPEAAQLDDLLVDLRKGAGYQLAVVMDEYDSTAGIATLEDLTEELVGEVRDEHDRTRTGVVRSRNETWIVFPGALRPDELFEQTGIRVPESRDYTTIAGYVLSELGRLPEPGDQVLVEGGVLRVVRMDKRKIDRIRFTRRTPAETEAAE